MRRPWRLVLLAVAIAASHAAAQQPPRVTRTHLVTLPDGYRPRTLFVAEGADDAVFAEAVGAGERVVHGDQAGPLFDAVSPPRLAPASRRVFYWAIGRRDGAPATSLMADGTAIATPIDRTGRFVFSPAGGRWAAVGGIEQRASSGAAAAETRPGPVWLWVDGALVGERADTSLPAFSRDGAHYAFLADDGLGMVGLYEDGHRIRLFEPPRLPATPVTRSDPVGPNMVAQFVLSYLSDGRLLTLTSDLEGWSVYRDDHRLASYAAVEGRARSDRPAPVPLGGALRDAATIIAGSLTSASDAPVVAWWARDAGAVTQWRVLRDGVAERQACKRPWRGEPPALSADGRHIAYACHLSAEGQPDQVIVVHDDRRFGPYDDVSGVTISADGRRVAFAAADAASTRPWTYLVDGKRHPLRFDHAFAPRFSRDGRHVAWVGQRNRGPDAARLVLLLDGNGVASSEQLVVTPSFAADADRLRWAVQRGRRISRVEVSY